MTPGEEFPLVPLRSRSLRPVPAAASPGGVSATSSRGSARARASAEPGADSDRLLLDRYRRCAERYDRDFAAYSERTLGVAMRLLEAPRGARVLDLACGTGLLSERILRADPDAHVIGVDVSDEMLHQARRRIASSTQASFLNGRAEEIPLPARSVHAIVIANAFHLIRQPVAAIAECRRVLRPGGSLIVVDWCRDFVAMKLLAAGLALTQRLERRVIGLGALRSMVAGGGFAIERAFRFRAKPAWGMMALRATVPTAPADAVDPSGERS